MDIDQGAVVHDLGLGRMDKAHPAHVRSQLIDLIEAVPVQLQCSLAIFLFAQIQQEELIRPGWRKLRFLDIHPPHPISFFFKFPDQVTSDKAACSTYQCSLHFSSSNKN